MATSSLLLISSCIISVLLQAASASKTRHFKWEVGYIYASPDCNEKILMGINGQFPGPTIRAKAGDTIHVELKNTLHTEGVVIHWHGIRQVGIKGFRARTETRNPVGADVHAWFQSVLSLRVGQLGTPWADGTASISQCAIDPEETFVYRFRVEKVTRSSKIHLVLPSIHKSNLGSIYRELTVMMICRPGRTSITGTMGCRGRRGCMDL